MGEDMATLIDLPVLTAADWESLPEDGGERWLVRGQLRVISEAPMTKRNRWHSQLVIAIGASLKAWRDRQPEPRGVVLGGEAGCVLQRDPDTVVGIDVAYFPAEAVEANPSTTLADGPPILAVEILSPPDRQQDIDEKVDLYLEAGVPLIWIVDPHLKTVVVVRPDAPPRLYNATETLNAEPHLPGFAVLVGTWFE